MTALRKKLPSAAAGGARLQPNPDFARSCQCIAHYCACIPFRWHAIMAAYRWKLMALE
jgi:hypothetical protein